MAEIGSHGLRWRGALRFGLAQTLLLAAIASLWSAYLLASLPTMPHMQNDSYGYVSFSEIRPHGYSLFLDVYSRLLGSLQYLPQMQAGLFSVAAFSLAFAVGQRTDNALAAVFTFVASASPPYLPGRPYLDFVAVMSDPLYAAALAGGAACVILNIGPEPKLWRIALASALFGFAVASRTIGYPCLGLFLAFSLWSAFRQSRRLALAMRIAATVAPAAIALTVAASSNYVHNGHFRIGSFAGVALLGKGLLLAQPLPPENPYSQLNWIAEDARPARESVARASDLRLKAMMARSYYEYLRWFRVWPKLRNTWRVTEYEQQRMAGRLSAAYIKNDPLGYAQLVMLDYGSLWLVPRLMTKSEAGAMREKYNQIPNVAYLPEFNRAGEGSNMYYQVIPPHRRPIYVYWVRIINISFLLLSFGLLAAILIKKNRMEFVWDFRDVFFLVGAVHATYFLNALSEAGFERYIGAIWSFVVAAPSLAAPLLWRELTARGREARLSTTVQVA